MPVKQWDFPINHANDADFRAWGSDLSASLAQVGLVQTADTGQINWTTVLRPAINTYAGYEIWRFPDSSLFLKWEYGTAANSFNIALRVQVGTGSSGAGTLTGATSANTVIGAASLASTPNGSSRRSFLTRDPNNAFFGFVGYVAVANPDANPSGSAGSLALFCVSRTVDASTTPTTQGYTVYAKSTSAITQLTQCQGVDIQNNISTATTTDKSFCYVPFTITSSLIGGLPQFFTHFVPLSTTVPRVVPQFGICTVFTSEIASGVTFSANPIGAALRTFIALPACNASGAVNDPSTGSTTPIYRLAIIWE
jgi:hypothetical protein